MDVSSGPGVFCSFNPRPCSVFRHLRHCKGGGATPFRVSELTVVELSGKKQADCSRRILAIGGAFFSYRREIFDVVMKGHRSNFREIGKFSNLHAYISKKYES